MEALEHFNSREKPKHRPLTLFRLLRGTLMMVIFVCTAFMALVYLAPFSAVFLRFFSVRRSRIATSFLFGTWLSLWPFMFEKINGTRVIFTGETVPRRERALILANHRTEIDWMFLWNFAARKECLGYIKYVLKSSLMKIPVLGWGFQILDFIPVERKWEIDEPAMRDMLSSYRSRDDPLWLAVFPEGTDFTENKCARSQKFAAENGLPILKNVLLPKTKGFNACIETLRSSLDGVYDVTIAYKHQCPLFKDIVFGVDPAEVHIHVNRISVTEIPESSDEAAAWLIERFRIKDQMLSEFSERGRFEGKEIEGELPLARSLVNYAAVVGLAGVGVYLTVFSSARFGHFAGLSCCYLTAASLFNIRPSPILGSGRKSG
ncbi:lysophosphatidyl acyltransferase 4 [Wolffia australiana]